MGVCLNCAPLLCTPSIPGLVISETEVDFGTIASTQPVSHVFTIKNQSEKTISIEYARASCGCFSIELQKSAIPASGSVDMVATLDPIGRVGNVLQTAEIGFYNESGEKGSVIFTARAFVREPIHLSSRSIAFQNIDLKTDNEQGYYKSDPILLSPASEDIQLSPQAEVPEQYGRAFLTSLGKRGSEYVLEAYFFPQQALEVADERNGSLTIKIYTDETKEQFVNLPVSWYIKSNFSVFPGRLLFIDNEAQDGDYLTIKTLNGSQFEISEVWVSAKKLSSDFIGGNKEQSEYTIALCEIATLLDNLDYLASSELVINTNHCEEKSVKIPISTLFSKVKDTK
ncbi:MAG: DUF1573 domain-containing protein [Holophagaceae bacterium]|nr:DUF1573 domain-containing protein [Holophagaceae bacterium]